MALLPLVYYPNEILTRRSDDVLELNQELADFVRDMRETMYASNGIGLAAPQVARNIRLITVDVEPDSDKDTFMHLINPVIVGSHGRTTYDEGCLSFPGLVAEVKRRKNIHVQAYDIHGKLLDFEASGLLAICIQHEIDHLNGINFVDRLSKVQRTLLLREYMSYRQAEKEDEEIAQILRVHGYASIEEAEEDSETVIKQDLGGPQL